jgi:hypothetical protein
MVNRSFFKDGIKVSVSQKYYHHDLWEDFKNGLYSMHTPLISNVRRSFDLLSSPADFKQSIKNMFDDWEYCIIHNLTNSMQNRKAYIGQATCNFNHGASILETTTAWNKMSLSQKQTANSVAKEMIIQYLVNLKYKNTIQLQLWKEDI